MSGPIPEWDDAMRGVFDDDDRCYLTPEQFFDYQSHPIAPEDLIVNVAIPAPPKLEAELIIEDANERAEIEESEFGFAPNKAGLAELQALLDGWVQRHPPSDHWFRQGEKVSLAKRYAAWLDNRRCVASPPPADSDDEPGRHIEVKGRLKEQSTVCVTRNEILCAMNQADKFILAIVLVDRDDDDALDGPHYIRNPFDREPGWGIASINYNVKDLLAKAEP